jgi:DNA repair protein RecO (recombination protein O)
MPEPRDYQTEAIIIKKNKLGEADRILTLCTPHFGKIQAVAKGVRRPKSKMAGHLELLTHSQISLSSGRTLDTITGCQTINSYLPVKNDFTLTSYGLYLAELTDHFTVDRQENNEVFVLLRDALELLCHVSNRDILLRHFEMKLLNETGFRPQLQQCIKCHKPLEPVSNYFNNNAGGVLCPSCSKDRNLIYTLSVNAIKILRILQNEDFAYVSKLKIGTELAYEIKEVIRRYIRYLLEREVKSVSWLDNL